MQACDLIAISFRWEQQTPQDSPLFLPVYFFFFLKKNAKQNVKVKETAREKKDPNIIVSL